MASSSSVSNTSNSDQFLCCPIFNCTKRDLIKAGFYRTKLLNNVVCCGCGWSSGDHNVTFRHLNFIHKIINPDCCMSSHVKEDFNNYAHHKISVIETEEMMRETFLMWPKTFPDIRDMVRTGFYYTGSGDAVSCIDCGVMLEHWKPTDVPKEEHKKASPTCNLLKCQ